MTQSPSPRSDARESLIQRAMHARQAGDADTAMRLLEDALDLPGDRVPVLLELAGIHLLAGRHNHALGAAHEALQHPLASRAQALGLMNLLGALSESHLVVAMAQQLPPDAWGDPNSMTEIAHLLMLTGAHEMAREFAAAVVHDFPGHAPGHYVMANIELSYGRFDAAERHANEFLKAEPDDCGMLWLLSRMQLPGADARIEKINRLLATQAYLQQEPEREVMLCYALHNELHDSGRFDEAWQALMRGSAVKRAGLGYDPASQHAMFAALHGWTRREIEMQDGFDDGRVTPVFIIGLHRSGTTLVEQILAGHSEVATGGETYGIRAQLRRASGLHYPDETDVRVIQGRDDYDYRGIGTGYMRTMAWRLKAKRAITDKLPSNYYNVGFIARALPRARFIVLNRDLMAVGLSNLRTLFSHACPHSYDQREFADHACRYAQLMRHWQALVPGRMLTVDYASLVSDPEREAHRMASFCGLSFEPGMVNLADRRNAVSTASSVTVRGGILKDRDRIKHPYQRYLEPMRAHLAAC